MRKQLNSQHKNSQLDKFKESKKSLVSDINRLWYEKISLIYNFFCVSLEWNKKKIFPLTL